MGNSKVKTSIIIIALLLGSITTFVVLMLTGFIYPYGSTEFGNWAMWIGAIFGGIASAGALAAAYFTSKTIKFLTGQHEDQQQLQRIHQYQAHKSVFFDHLNEITERNTNFRITAKLKLYLSLFPDNSVSSTLVVADKDNCPFLEAIKIWNELITYLDSTVYIDELDPKEFECKFLDKIDKCYRAMSIERAGKKEFGDVYFRNVGIPEPRKIINLISAYRELHELKTIIDDLVSISKLQGVVVESTRKQMSNVFVLYYISNQDRSYFVENALDSSKAFEICAKYLCYLNIRDVSNVNIIHNCMFYTTIPHQTMSLLNDKQAQLSIKAMIKADCYKILREHSEYHPQAQRLIYDIEKAEQQI